VEGAEPQVLDGMKETLKEDCPTVILESIPSLWNVSLESVYKQFWDRYYEIILPDETSNSLYPIQQDDLNALHDHSGNILLRPRE
jgi:hypothetical protein